MVANSIKAYVSQKLETWVSMLWRSVGSMRQPPHLPDQILAIIFHHLSIPQASNDRFLITGPAAEGTRDLHQGRRTLLQLSRVNSRLHGLAMAALLTCFVPLNGDDPDKMPTPQSFTSSTLLSKHRPDVYKYCRLVALRIRFGMANSLLKWSSIQSCSNLTQLHLYISFSGDNSLQEAISELPPLPRLSAVALTYADPSSLSRSSGSTSNLMLMVANSPNLKHLRTNYIDYPALYSFLLKARKMHTLAFEDLSHFLEYQGLEFLLRDLGELPELILIGCNVPLTSYANLATARVSIGCITLAPSRSDSNRSHILLREGRSCLLEDATFTSRVRLSHLSQMVYLTLPTTIREVILDHVEIRTLSILLSRLSERSPHDGLSGLEKITVRGYLMPNLARRPSGDLSSGTWTLLEETLTRLETSRQVTVQPENLLERLRRGVSRQQTDDDDTQSTTLKRDNPKKSGIREFDSRFRL